MSEPTWTPLTSDSLGFLGAPGGGEDPTPDAATPHPGSLTDLFGDGGAPITHVDVTRVAPSTPVEAPAATAPAPTAPAPAPVFGAPVSSSASPAVVAATASSVEVVTAAASRELVDLRTSARERYEAERDSFEALLRGREPLYAMVDEILNFIAREPAVQGVVNEFVLTRDLALDFEQRTTLERTVSPRLLEARVRISNPADIPTVYDMVYDELIGISVVGDLWRDPDVDEIMIDAWNRITVERFGVIEDTGRRFRSQDHANRVARNLSQLVSDRMVSRSNALVTAFLPGARVQFIWGNLAIDGLAIAIRKFGILRGMDSLLKGASLSTEMRDFLAAAVMARATVLVSGGTSTGKTTMINALSEFIPDIERVITIEDAQELKLSNHHVVALQSKTKASADDTVIYSQEDLMVASLRMRPDRIIVGEIREPTAAAVMLQAANTGHDGTMTTIHATSADVALNNRMTMLLMRSGTGFSEEVARSEVAQAFDIVIQITKQGQSGHRYISEINLCDMTFAGQGTIRSLPIFTGTASLVADPNDPALVNASVHFRKINQVPRTTNLGIKLMDLGPVGQRWVS